MMMFPFFFIILSFFMSDALGSVMKRKLRNRRQFGRNIGTGLGLKEAEHLMDRLADGSHARLELDEKGLIVYAFR